VHKIDGLTLGGAEAIKVIARKGLQVVSHPE
jgi:hypothetical protein